MNGSNKIIENLSVVYHTVKDEIGIVTTCNIIINIYATIATAITTAQSERCGQYFAG